MKRKDMVSFVFWGSFGALFASFLRREKKDENRPTNLSLPLVFFGLKNVFINEFARTIIFGNHFFLLRSRVPLNSHGRTTPTFFRTVCEPLAFVLRFGTGIWFFL